MKSKQAQPYRIDQFILIAIIISKEVYYLLHLILEFTLIISKPFSAIQKYLSVRTTNVETINIYSNRKSHLRSTGRYLLKQ